MKHRLPLIRLLLAVLALLASLSVEAAVRAELDRNRLVEGETVTLTILTDDPRQNLDGDFSVLERDFEILDRRSETQLSIVNGQQTAVVRLLLTLEPRRAGKFEIAPLQFGQDKTKPISIQVDAAPELEPGEQPPVFIEVEITPSEGPYFVHAQLGLVVRVFYQQNLTEAAISQPDPTPASVRLMQETPYQAERGGERYRVLERNYAVFPERSGELSIPPMQLTGRLVERRTSGVWQPTVRGRRIQVESEPIRLTVDPKPAEFAGSAWQPARDYQLTQQISSGDTLRVGEPVTRTVMVDAVGLEENMIVEPAWPEVTHARIYPDQPQGITRDDGTWVLGHKEFRYAVVPEQEGELVLPELRVDWWDTRENRPRTAVLESHTVMVGPSALVPSPAAGVTADSQFVDAADPAHWPAAGGESGHWRRLALLFAGLWLATLFFIWWSRGRSQKRGAQKRTGLPEEEAALLNRLKRSCDDNDRRLARRVLQQWLRTFGTGDASLLEFAADVNDESLREAVYAMDAAGFRPERETAWAGRNFWKLFDQWRRSKAAAAQSSTPPPTDLYARENRVTGPS